ncbi:uncharacterized protein LOC135162536 isoform X2 [Diachasmimorpha longicaudata]|uniref:uncharacterized protein LOC135162536 isoform X2 n=1 Tax=Diachasmimorpha longicaudata TaxID=58733 RepID=UPI0030B8D31D
MENRTSAVGEVSMEMSYLENSKWMPSEYMPRRVAKTGAERMRACHARKRLLAAGIDPEVLETDDGMRAALYLPPRPRSPPKSGAERMKALRERKKNVNNCDDDEIRTIARIPYHQDEANSESVIEMKEESEIETELELPNGHNVMTKRDLVPYLKTKWKSLRDAFRSEMKKKTLNQKTTAPKGKTWRHYKELLFLKEQMLPKKPSGNSSKRKDDPLAIQTSGKTTKRIKITGVASVSETANGHTNDRNFVNIKEEPELILDEIQTDGQGDKDFVEIFTSCEDSNLLSGSQDAELTGSTTCNSNGYTSGKSLVDPMSMSGQVDDNYHFLMSLLPHMQKLPGERQMFLRMQMQEMVYKDVYKK